MSSSGGGGGGLRVHQVERLLAEHGFLLVRQRGSHRQYANARGQRLSVTVHGGAHTGLSWRQVDAIRRDLERLGAAGTSGTRCIRPVGEEGIA